MFMMLLGMRLLEGMFAVGIAGCVLVLILTTVDDIRELLLGDKGTRETSG